MLHQIFWKIGILMLLLSTNKISQIYVAGFCTTGWISEYHSNMIFTPNVTKINVGEELDISCRPGYFLRGASRLRCDLVHGFVIPSMMFSCDEITCAFGQLYRPTLTVTPKKDSYFYNETVSLQCDTGYTLRGPSTARCTENFEFDVPSTLDCEAEVKCHKYDSEINILHLIVTPDKDEYRYNERVSLKCEAGYTLQGPSTATCLEGFNLSGPLSCLADYCDAEWIYSRTDHSTMMYSSSHPSRIRVGESIRFSCPQGYRLLGTVSVKCLPSGEFEGYFSSCEEIRCRKDPELDEVSVTPDKISYDFNETINFHCSEHGKGVYGPTSARCLEHGWEYEGSSLPVCRKRFCDAEWILRKPRMYTTPSISGRVGIGTRFRPNCYDNYTPRCAKTILCLPGGFLNTGMMCYCEDRHCYRKSNDTFDKPHLITTPSKGRYRYEETLRLSCEEGYTLRGPSSARCSDGQRFVLNLNEEPECVR